MWLDGQFFGHEKKRIHALCMLGYEFVLERVKIARRMRKIVVCAQTINLSREEKFVAG